ncbi:MAG: hypothetical protein K0Q49_2276 [Haloplasmataceae bacterium]|nr:hypothetical protein [Haloplasmataceae bacterium]
MSTLLKFLNSNLILQLSIDTFETAFNGSSISTSLLFINLLFTYKVSIPSQQNFKLQQFYNSINIK